MGKYVARDVDAPLTAKRLREVLSYDRKTGIFTWIVVPGKRSDLKGKRAGSPSHGYTTIRIDYRIYRANRLAWLYVHAAWPPRNLDHENRKRGDDRFENLRLATHQQNIRNGSLRRNSTSGEIGISWCKQQRQWRAHITVDAKMIHLGRFDTKGDAVSARRVAALKMFGKFAPHEARV